MTRTNPVQLARRVYSEWALVSYPGNSDPVTPWKTLVAEYGQEIARDILWTTIASQVPDDATANTYFDGCLGYVTARTQEDQ